MRLLCMKDIRGTPRKNGNEKGRDFQTCMTTKLDCEMNERLPQLGCVFSFSSPDNHASLLDGYAFEPLASDYPRPTRSLRNKRFHGVLCVFCCLTVTRALSSQYPRNQSQEVNNAQYPTRPGLEMVLVSYGRGTTRVRKKMD